MQALARLLLDICLLRRGPQELPYSLPLVRGLVVALAALKLGSALLLEIPEPFLRTLLSLALLLSLPWLLLAIRGHRPRYLQTLAAFAGTGLLFSLLFLPVAWIAAGVPAVDPGAPPLPAQVALGWLTLALLGWKLAINGHILRHAMDWPRLPALLLALALFLIEFGVFRTLFAAP
jgi:hypothetical protein